MKRLGPIGAAFLLALAAAITGCADGSDDRRVGAVATGIEIEQVGGDHGSLAACLRRLSLAAVPDHERCAHADLVTVFQPGGPPVLLGATSRWSPKRVVEYCDGWFPIGSPEDLAPPLEAIRVEAANAGRSMDELDLTVGTLGIVRRDPFPEPQEIER